MTDDYELILIDPPRWPRRRIRRTQDAIRAWR